MSRRLPLAVASIVLGVVAIILYQGFRRIDDLAAEVAVAHLQASSHQLRAALQASAARLRRDMGQLTRLPAVEQAVSVFATEADRDAARDALTAEMRRNGQAIVSMAIWSSDGRLVVIAGDTSVARLFQPSVTELAAEGTDTIRASIAPLVARRDSIFVSVAGRVRDRAGRVQASVVQVRHSARNAAALDLLRGLVGPDARILLGNARENLWSDFSERVPVEVTTADSSAGEHVTDGVSYLHSIEPVPGTPWRILVQVPRKWATARAGHVILQIGTVAVFMLLVGTGIAWLAIHKSLQPLEEVTESVGRLAAGDLGERVRISTDDEFGKLAGAFNAMAGRVEDSTRQLAARAHALEAANRELQQTQERILNDVTHRRRLEEELRHAQKMDAVGRLAGGVAHDFNNILTVIDAHAEFAMKANESEETRMQDIAEIRKASAAAARLTRQLLAFSRKQALTPVELDLNAIVKGLQGMLTRLIGQHITIHAELADPLWTVHADAGHLEQVIMNLAVNARDAMPEGGNLSFRTANLEVGPDFDTPAGEPVPEGQYALLAVEDSGVGIPEELQTRVFEPFFTTKHAGQGTGLGLSTVYGIVKQSGGFIWLYSEIGHGTSFKILLPRSTTESSQPALTRTSEHRIQSIAARILLVEDQPAVRMALARALRNAGFVVDEATDAETAERLLEGADHFDLVVSDMMMTGKTGGELAAGILSSGRDIPVVIMSGYSEEFTNREWKLPPNVAFLDKPVAPSELVRIINRLIT